MDEVNGSMQPTAGRFQPIVLKNSATAFAASQWRETTSQINPESTIAAQEGFEYRRECAQEGTAGVFNSIDQKRR